MSKSEISSAEQKFLTETDKLILKLDTIITSIRGKEGPIDYKSIKDGFDKTRFKVNEKLKEIMNKSSDDWVVIPKGIDIIQDISVDWMKMIRDTLDEKLKALESDAN